MTRLELARPPGAGWPPRRPAPDVPRPAWPADRWRPLATLAGHPVAISVLVTVAGTIIWLAVFPRVGTDLSAQLARAGWARQYPGAAYLFSWYGGIYPASYSLLAPYLLALTGTREAMAIAAAGSAALLTLLLTRHRVPRPRAAALWAGAAMLTELTAGRSAFILGVTAALACIAVADGHWRRGRGRWLAVGGLAALASSLSPVAGLFLGVPAAALVLTGRWRDGLVIGMVRRAAAGRRHLALRRRYAAH